jgi:hypothetical protein
MDRALVAVDFTTNAVFQGAFVYFWAQLFLYVLVIHAYNLGPVLAAKADWRELKSDGIHGRARPFLGFLGLAVVFGSASRPGWTGVFAHLLSTIGLVAMFALAMASLTEFLQSRGAVTTRLLRYNRIWGFALACAVVAWTVYSAYQAPSPP